MKKRLRKKLQKGEFHMYKLTKDGKKVYATKQEVFEFYHTFNKRWKAGELTPRSLITV